ncbi:MAG: ECF-type sigma factor [Planctomycetota bacterium]
MSDPPPRDEVSVWIEALQAGDADATERLWEFCLPRLLRYSKNKLPPHFRRVLDEEDVALSAFKSFCIRAADGSLGEIHDRDQLWKLLLTITSRKASGYMRHQTRKKRGGGFVSGESTFLAGDGSEALAGIDGVADSAASPAMMAEFQNTCEALLDQLDDDMLRTVAMLRLEGYSVNEIAEKLECAKRSIERRLNLIRAIWQDAASGGELDDSS